MAGAFATASVPPPIAFDPIFARGLRPGLRQRRPGHERGPLAGHANKSQSFYRRYGSVLPTSLVCIVPSTRGFAPWRPDAVRSVRARTRLSSTCSDFQGTTRDAPDDARENVACRPRRPPHLRLTRFRGRRTTRLPCQEKITLPGARVAVSEFGNASPLGPSVRTGKSPHEARESMPDSLLPAEARTNERTLHVVAFAVLLRRG